MEPQEIQTAIAAANVALTGGRRRETRSFASIELRETEEKSGRWHLAATAALGCVTLLAVVVAWFY